MIIFNIKGIGLSFNRLIKLKKFLQWINNYFLILQNSNRLKM